MGSSDSTPSASTRPGEATLQSQASQNVTIASVVTFRMQAAGDITTFNATATAETLAGQVGVDPSEVAINATAASVDVDVAFTTTNVSKGAEIFHTVNTFDASKLSTWLGISVLDCGKPTLSLQEIKAAWMAAYAQSVSNVSQPQAEEAPQTFNPHSAVNPLTVPSAESQPAPVDGVPEMRPSVAGLTAERRSSLPIWAPLLTAGVLVVLLALCTCHYVRWRWKVAPLQPADAMKRRNSNKGQGHRFRTAPTSGKYHDGAAIDNEAPGIVSEGLDTPTRDADAAVRHGAAIGTPPSSMPIDAIWAATEQEPTEASTSGSSSARSNTVSEPSQPEPTRSAPKLTRSANSPTGDDSSSATAADTPASESAALFVVSKPMPSQARGKLPPIQKKLPASPSKLLQKAPALPGFEEADGNKDGKLDRDEFAAFLKKTRSNAALQLSERHLKPSPSAPQLSPLSQPSTPQHRQAPLPPIAGKPLGETSLFVEEAAEDAPGHEEPKAPLASPKTPGSPKPLSASVEALPEESTSSPVSANKAKQKYGGNWRDRVWGGGGRD